MEMRLEIAGKRPQCRIRRISSTHVALPMRYCKIFPETPGKIVLLITLLLYDYDTSTIMSYFILGGSAPLLSAQPR